LNHHSIPPQSIIESGVAALDTVGVKLGNFSITTIQIFLEVENLRNRPVKDS